MKLVRQKVEEQQMLTDDRWGLLVLSFNQQTPPPPPPAIFLYSGSHVPICYLNESIKTFLMNMQIMLDIIR